MELIARESRPETAEIGDAAERERYAVFDSNEPTAEPTERQRYPTCATRAALTCLAIRLQSTPKEQQFFYRAKLRRTLAHKATIAQLFLPNVQMFLFLPKPILKTKSDGVWL